MAGKRTIYLDHNATTPLHPEVKKVLTEAMEEFGNPSSLHSFGRRARQLVDESREKVASFIGASSEEIIFTGSGSEANNTVLSIMTCQSSHCSSCGSGNETHIITSSIEHPCILEASKCLRDRGVKVVFAPVDRFGKVDIGVLTEELKKGAGLVSIMMANNEIGTIQDIKTIAKLSHDHGALFHTDAVQAAGKVPVNVRDLGVDFLTVSGHKIYGPKGIGAVYVKKGVPFCPLIRGGHQEKGRRAGTENTLGIIGLAAAVAMREKEMAAEHGRFLAMKETLTKGIEKRIGGIQFNGHPADALANTVNVSFDGAEGEAILLYLDLAGIAVSTGSACASGSLDPSHVLLATGLPVERAHGSIRVSMGRGNTPEEIDFVIDTLPKVIEKIRSMSTVTVKGHQ
ncbi:MAG: cysteine desulfurase family protein [Candidatus Omnitrophota bacterium]